MGRSKSKSNPVPDAGVDQTADPAVDDGDVTADLGGADTDDVDAADLAHIEVESPPPGAGELVDGDDAGSELAPDQPDATDGNPLESSPPAPELLLLIHRDTGATLNVSPANYDERRDWYTNRGFDLS